MTRLHIVFIALLLLGLTACGASGNQEEPAQAVTQNEETHEGSYITLTADTFDDFIAEGRTVVDFWAPWCGPCRQMAPIFSELSDEMEGVRFGKLNTDDHSAVPRRFGIRGIPTLIVFQDGKEVNRVVGLRGKEDLRTAIAE